MKFGEVKKHEFDGGQTYFKHNLEPTFDATS
jgi:hypothetical protein